VTADTGEEPLEDEVGVSDEDLDDEVFDEDDDDLDDEDEDEDDLDDDEDDEDLDDEDEDEDDYEPGDVNAVDDGGYEAGDVNTIEAGTRPRSRTAREAPQPGGGTPAAVLTYLAEAMADDPDAVVIRQEERRGTSVLRLHVAPGDMGRVIGRRGRTAQAIRTLVAAAGARDGVQVAVDIVDD
jgi:predicted RNA-binding protein YlqC (UPF0109 family)